MATITMGGEAIDRGSATGGGWTFIQLTNPANESGIITSIEIWASGNLSNVKVATFYLVSGDNYSTRDTVNIGTVVAGSKQTITVDSIGSPISLEVQAGDFIGHYQESDNIEHDLSGFSGVYRINSDEIPCTNVTFSLLAGDCSSIKGIGATPTESNAIFFGTNI